jgi:hypothetical protein
MVGAHRLEVAEVPFFQSEPVLGLPLAMFVEPHKVKVTFLVVELV